MKFLLLIVFIYFTIQQNHYIGTGIADITGPPAGVGMMGYAQIDQINGGILGRLYARAYIVEDLTFDKKRIVYVVGDMSSGFISIVQGVVKELRKLYGDMYTEENIVIAGQHTHSCIGGASHHVLYNIANLGYEDTNYKKIVNGIVEAIKMAHNSVRLGFIKYNSGILENSNINRSPTAYDANPEEERRRYNSNTDKTVHVLRFEDQDGTERGAISWFAVHTTSVNNKNQLLNGDNKGWASYLFEEMKNKNNLYGKGPFVAAFPQPASGDISPNTRGAFCPNGRPCDANSTCNGNSNQCHGLGPGKDDLESSFIIGNNQFQASLRLYSSATTVLKGPVDFRHKYFKISDKEINARYTQDGRVAKTCRPAVGYSFAAGTTDGPGGFFFQQGNNRTGNPFWDLIRNLISEPTREQIECQRPKPIFLDLGMTNPYDWVPQIVPVQLLRIGQLLLPVMPGEHTTMSGRRYVELIKSTNARERFIPENELIVILSTMSNAFLQYTTTPEEYNIQRYEGGSTLFGRNQLNAFRQELDNITISMIRHQRFPSEVKPRDMYLEQISLIPGVVLDTTPKEFGDVHTQPRASYKKGEKVTVEFWSGHMMNGHWRVESFFTIERLENNNWVVEVSDSDYHTVIRWRRHWRSVVFPDSRVTITWETRSTTKPGTYRIRHFGFAKKNAVSPNLTPYSGTTTNFNIE